MAASRDLKAGVQDKEQQRGRDKRVKDKLNA